MEQVIATVAALLVAFGLLSGVLQRTPVTAPMFALTAGVLLGPGLGLLPTTAPAGGVLLLVELTLAVLLFVDATRVNLRLARRNGQVPARMLVLGLPLVIGLGTAAGMVVLGLDGATAFLLACLLAPTDAALAQPLLHDERVPQRLRQAINIESGLNDGLVTPFLAVALVAVDVRTGPGAGGLALEAVRLVGGGLVVGLAVGGGIGLLLRRWGWRRLQPGARQVAMAALPVLAFSLATMVDGNGFIAAFVAGVAVGHLVDDAHDLLEYGEATGELLALLTFLAFGAVFLDVTSAVIDGRALLYALLSLTVVRMLPVALSLVGLRLRWDTVTVLGWFGPRGLATIVFALDVLEQGREEALVGGERVFGIAAVVVVASVFLHGLSARPLAGWYAGRVGRTASDHGAADEDVAVLPTRRGRLGH